jgi:non-homologous end joining protein Ku
MAMLRPNGHFLTMAMMRYSDELIGSDLFPVPTAPPSSDREKQLAMDLLAHLSAPFDPTRHPNEYRSRVQAAVDRKLEQAAQRNDAGAASRAAPVFDLTALLARSLDETPKPGVKKATAKTSKPRKAKRAEP